MNEINQNMRYKSLDIFRGFTILWMIIVNNQGDWHHVYSILKHASWNGIRPTDFIFPFFLFIVGASISVSSYDNNKINQSTKTIVMKILRRSFLLIIIGIILNGIPFFNLTTIRIPGVLQRIGICYLFGSLFFLFFKNKIHIIFIIVSLLSFYWFIMTTIIPPGQRAILLDKTGNAAWYLDSIIFKGHTYSKSGFDPEGLLSTIPAIATTLMGILGGSFILKEKPSYRVGAIFSILIILAGFLLSYMITINKQLWTPSYVFITGGAAFTVLLVLQKLCSRYNNYSPKIFISFGKNTFLAYILSSSLGRFLALYPLYEKAPIKNFIYIKYVYISTMPYFSSLLYSLLLTALIALILFFLNRKQLYLKL